MKRVEVNAILKPVKVKWYSEEVSTRTEMYYLTDSSRVAVLFAKREWFHDNIGDTLLEVPNSIEVLTDHHSWVNVGHSSEANSNLGWLLPK
jgi:hypothetical protein